MTSRSSLRIALAAAFFLVGVSGCERDLDPLAPAPFPSDAAVFLDGFAPGLVYEAFGLSKVDAFNVDEQESYKGTSSIRLTIPSSTDRSGGFAGGAFIDPTGRDLSGYNALTFWAKASTAAVFDLGGLGLSSSFTATWEGIHISSRWTKYVIPIPNPSRLTQLTGLFHFADGSEFPVGYEVWIDELQFEKLGTIASEQPAIDTRVIDAEVGATTEVTGTRVTYDIAGKLQTINAAPAYFTFSSSDPSVATVDESGLVRVVGTGTAIITAKLGETDASGALTIQTPRPPDVAAPTPDLPAENVISLFSDAYTNVPVDTWSAVWDAADVADIQILGDNVKKYSNLVFAGIEAKSPPIDASAMERFHMDFWTSDPTAAPAVFRVKLVDFGADGAFGGGDDVEHELTFDATTTPALATGTWVALDVPLSAFAGLTTRSNIAQMIISGDPNTVYLDNIYFYTAGDGGGAAVIDFEPEGLGASWTWSVFENADNPPLEFVANPDPTGANTSATVAMFNVRQAGQPWAGTQTLDKETFSLDESNAIVRVMVYKSVISDVGIKFEKGTASTGEIKVPNTVVNQWEELTFDFSGVIGSEVNIDITGLVVFPDFQGGRAADHVVYFDNISFSAVGGSD
jgi:hypothetical protein